MIKESGVFSLSVLDKTCTFDTISRFGYQSGRDADKFAGFEHSLDSNGCPYVTKQVCSVFECKVVSSQDLGSHTLFIAEVTDAKVVSGNAPLTYADYQANVKPKKSDSAAAPAKKIVAWKCKICGYVYEGSELPADFECPICGHPAEDFEPVYED
jgi:flavin reductase (DIM6/NTAB) family NADH-FMN oxidoreductase RutF